MLLLLDLERDFENDFDFTDFMDLSLIEVLLLSVPFLPTDDFLCDLFVMVLYYLKLSVVFWLFDRSELLPPFSTELLVPTRLLTDDFDLDLD